MEGHQYHHCNSDTLRCVNCSLDHVAVTYKCKEIKARIAIAREESKIRAQTQAAKEPNNEAEEGIPETQARQTGTAHSGSPPPSPPSRPSNTQAATSFSSSSSSFTLAEREAKMDREIVLFKKCHATALTFARGDAKEYHRLINEICKFNSIENPLIPPSWYLDDTEDTVSMEAPQVATADTAASTPGVETPVSVETLQNVSLAAQIMINRQTHCPQSQPSASQIDSATSLPSGDYSKRKEPSSPRQQRSPRRARDIAGPIEEDVAEIDPSRSRETVPTPPFAIPKRSKSSVHSVKKYQSWPLQVSSERIFNHHQSKPVYPRFDC